LQECGDRVEAALPGEAARWGMLRLLRVDAPAAGRGLSILPAAV
jgi:hypothetical protein